MHFEQAIGSAFKLYVLSTLSREIAARRRSWNDVVPLDQRSYPSGILQDWPQGTPMTLQTLATLMIAISDNTATDQLAATSHAAPELGQRFSTTREFFQL